MPVEDQKPLSERLLGRLKNKRPIALLVVIFAVVGGIASFGDSLSKLYSFAVTVLSAEKSVDVAGKWDSVKAWNVVDAVVKARERDPRNLFCSETPCKAIHTRLGEYALLYRNKESILLALASIDEGLDCHACAPKLSFFEFEKRDRGWKLIDSAIAVVAWGSYGKVNAFGEVWSDPKVHVIGENIYGVVLEGEYMAQGIIQSDTAIYAKVGDSFKKIFNIQTSDDDTGHYLTGKPRNDWKSEIKIQSGATGFFDLVIERRGIRKGQKFMEMELFKFDGKEYVSSHLYR